jgi:hypothetical protein
MRNRISHPIALSFLALVLTVNGAAAQRRGAPVANSGGRGFFMIGVQYMDLEDLNIALLDRGYPDFDETFLTLGGGGFAVRNRVLIGGEGHGLLQSQQTSPNGALRTGLFAGYGMFNVGYQVVRSRSLALYPLLGIGGGGTTLLIRERATVSFDDVLRDPGRSSSLTKGALLVGGAVGGDWFLPFGSARGGLILGFRAGYTYAPLDAEWRMDGTDVAGGPSAELTGPYVRFSIGGGSR